MARDYDRDAIGMALAAGAFLLVPLVLLIGLAFVLYWWFRPRDK